MVTVNYHSYDKQMKHSLALNQREEQAVKAFVAVIRKNLKDEVLEIKIFGSKVRGDYSQDSDIDILIVLKERSKKIIDNIYEELMIIELEYDSKISLTIFSQSEYQHNLDAHTPFMKSLANEAVAL
jgi:predicted nucleotidyltransferase